MHAFDRSEFLARLERTRARMEELEIELLLIVDAANIVWLTGYLGDSSYVPQMLIIGLDDLEPELVLRKMDVACATHSAYLAPENIIGYPEDLIAHPEGTDGFDFVIDRIRTGRLASSRIGIERGSTLLSGATWDKFRQRLDRATFIDVTGEINRLRSVKSPRELLYMRQAATIADKAMAAAVAAIRPGVRECDAAAQVVAALTRGTPDFGGTSVQSPAMPAGARSSAPHLHWTDRPYAPDTTITLELGGARYRYMAALSRTVHLGSPPQRLLDLHAVTLEGAMAALAAVEPGRLCEDVEAAFRKVTAKAGVLKESRVGYGIGIDWGEGTGSFRPGDKTVLQPDQTYHLMCGMWQGVEWGYVFSETIRVTEAGCESFAAMPRELFVHA